MDKVIRERDAIVQQRDTLAQMVQDLQMQLYKSKYTCTNGTRFTAAFTGCKAKACIMYINPNANPYSVKTKDLTQIIIMITELLTCIVFGVIIHTSCS